MWTEPAASEENVAWTREAFEAMAPYLAGGRYVNYFAEDDGGEEAARAAYGPNFERLVDVKRTYDPDDVFGGLR